MFSLRSSTEHRGTGPVEQPSGSEHGLRHQVQILVSSLAVTWLSDLNTLKWRCLHVAHRGVVGIEKVISMRHE